MLVIKSVSAAYKTSALPTVLSLGPLHLEFVFSITSDLKRNPPPHFLTEGKADRVPPGTLGATTGFSPVSAALRALHECSQMLISAWLSQHQFKRQLLLGSL